MYDTTDRIIVGVDAADSRPRKCDRNYSIWCILVFGVMVAVQLWLGSITVDVARCWSGTIVVGTSNNHTGELCVKKEGSSKLTSQFESFALVPQFPFSRWQIQEIGRDTPLWSDPSAIKDG